MDGLSASTEPAFLSHPEEKGITLESHLVQVAERARELMDETGFGTAASTASFYAGLFHDLGKLNPFYQQIFRAEERDRPALEKLLLGEYERQHSIFSAWGAYKLLDGRIDSGALTLALLCIAAHHSSLDSKMRRIENSYRFTHTQQKVHKNIPIFVKQISSPHFSSLDWSICDAEFGRPMDYQFYIRPHTNYYEKFLEAGAVFSSLIQADRGSFAPWKTPKYDIEIDTSKLVRPDAKLGSIRQQFHDVILADHSDEHDIYTINAPTGTGKTRIFLDLVDRYVQTGSLERVFYFSPLLALTEDFEGKLKDVVDKRQLSDILAYNHAFSGRLDRKLEGPSLQWSGSAWNFENESFNSKFIITTTQRLLITLYSNSASDKMKLISFKNSLLIIDEVQTIPKVILSNLVQLLKVICKKMKSKVLLVSATIPSQLMQDADVRKSKFPQELANEYHRMTKKKIEFYESSKCLQTLTGKAMVMLNTKRKALSTFNQLEGCDPVYITTGIRKKDRSELVRGLKDAGNRPVVATQVLEAGVDVSFSKVYRELAPLDNIVQVMGRLNREGETDNPVLAVFQIDENPKPYSPLEVEESIKVIREVQDSEELYGRLPAYYALVSEKNLRLKGESDNLNEMMKRMDFVSVWKFVNEKVFEEDHGETVIIPDDENQLDIIRAELTATGRMDRNTYRKYSGLSAALPGHPEKLRIDNMFDEDLAEKGIWLPKRTTLRTLYDEKVGLDKWLIK